MSTDIGVIAEEKNDVEVLYEFTCKLTLENKFSFSKFYAHGCGKLRRKCGAWAHNLLTRGCSLLVIIHDLDDNDEITLKKELQDHINSNAFAGTLILIPKYEIEAWLLSDELALKDIFNMNKAPKVPKHPENVPHPKEYLRDLVWKCCKKQYINVIHNRKIAKAIRIERLSVCPSFSSYPTFITNILS